MQHIAASRPQNAWVSVSVEHAIDGQQEELSGARRR